MIPADDPSAPVTPQAPLHDAAFMADLRQLMLRFATLQLSNAHAAEDAVQEALVGALKNAQSFSGRAAFKTWVFAILKNKIADTLRLQQRSVNVGSLVSDADDDEALDELFDRTGHWQADERPTTWSNPQACLQQQQFWVVFETCLNALPPQQARVFMMKEYIELDTPEICNAVGITTTNLNVMLYRARLRLRECLENRWFVQGERA